MPLLTHYALACRKPRKLRRLYDRRAQMMRSLKREFFANSNLKMIDGSKPLID